MDKMRFETSDFASELAEKIAALAPSVVTEKSYGGGGANQQQPTLKRAINFDLLRTLLGDDVADDEAYEFTWVGKKEAVMEAGKPIRKTLRPCPEESKSFDSTENLYIEGDNLDVLKLLQESYLGKVKMIYIDPPYNTGNDFVYRDNFTQNLSEYEEDAGVFDEDGERLFKNTESNGRFHSDWCSMIYPRLVLARNLLSEDGVIFISIDDGEISNLKKMSDEIFGESNFISQLIWKKKSGGGSDSRYIAIDHEYILIYAKNLSFQEKWFMPMTDDQRSQFKLIDNNFDKYGPYKLKNLHQKGIDTNRPNLKYGIVCPDGTELYPPTIWRWSRETFDAANSAGEIEFVKNSKGEWNVFTKMYLYKNGEEYQVKPRSILTEVGFTRDGNKEIQDLIKQGIFSYPKPSKLVKYLLRLLSGNTGIYLDFFSGSATTAHAVMQLNAEDGGNRKFIMVQLPETTDENSEAYKAGYKNICEIGKERIRRAGDKIKEENKDKENIENLDIGFRVLKLDDSNMKDVYYAAGAYTQDLLSLTESNIKDDRNDMDLLYGCLLDWGLPLSQSHKTEEIDGVTVHTYNDGDLIACFAEKVSETVVKEIAKRQPLRVVFRDSSFSSSPEKINVEEIFKLMAPNTTIKVL
ncbi:hypothetical protein MmiAt1_03370 [Methanimicrococcus sp. At1]|uniref:DNA methylase N-4/N-6 domain-containing protein n=1 Tax=Methanimicrococcus hacksteinii TaxID=3028293 RepID=A0ABU3VN18_9EURY|nr:site-specific DNA-methyltransferase [Methanimicrococcus sp. At1]MDV0444796.1 hypothetical protein [Methanimicrococcus sp. At1]